MTKLKSGEHPLGAAAPPLPRGTSRHAGFGDAKPPDNLRARPKFLVSPKHREIVRPGNWRVETMKHARGIISVIVATAIAGPASAQAPVPRAAPYALALEAAQTALATCLARGWPVTAVVLDAYGEEQILLRDDRPYVANDTDQAKRKAYTALSGSPSAEMMVLMDTNPNAYARAAYVNPRITPQAGGLPIKMGDITIGALGVSGAGASNGTRGGLNDQSCAAAGLEKIAGRLR